MFAFNFWLKVTIPHKNCFLRFEKNADWLFYYLFRKYICELIKWFRLDQLLMWKYPARVFSEQRKYLKGRNDLSFDKWQRGNVAKSIRLCFNGTTTISSFISEQMKYLKIRKVFVFDMWQPSNMALWQHQIDHVSMRKQPSWGFISERMKYLKIRKVFVFGMWQRGNARGGGHFVSWHLISGFINNDENGNWQNLSLSPLFVLIIEGPQNYLCQVVVRKWRRGLEGGGFKDFMITILRP